MITRFTGQHAYLSNFSQHQVWLPEFSQIPFASAEHAFQAAKTLDPDGRVFVASAPEPRMAKQRGRHVPLRPDWEDVKRAVMLQVLLAKFDPSNPGIRDKLARTEGTLVEGNTWGDQYWGAVPLADGTYPSESVVWAPGPDDPPSCYLVGQNWLGKCLMMTREVIRR